MSGVVGASPPIGGFVSIATECLSSRTDHDDRQLRFNVEISMVSERDTPQTSTRELRSSAGLLALLALPRVGPQTALRAAITADPDAVGAGLTSAWRAQMNAAGEQIHRYTAAGVQLVSFFDEVLSGTTATDPSAPAAVVRPWQPRRSQRPSSGRGDWHT